MMIGRHHEISSEAKILVVLTSFATHDATHGNRDSHVLGRVYAAVHVLQVVECIR
jgi:hypothetical protein